MSYKMTNVNFLKNHKFQLCIAGEYLLKVTEISTGYDLKPA